MSNTKRRHYLRARIQGTMTVHDIEGDLFFNTVDISQGGAFIHSPILLEEGDEVQVSFSLPPLEKAITARARVVRGTKADGDVDQSGMGLEFLDLAPEEKRAIADYVVRVLNATF